MAESRKEQPMAGNPGQRFASTAIHKFFSKLSAKGH
jgi:hypothetical protein